LLSPRPARFTAPVLLAFALGASTAHAQGELLPDGFAFESVIVDVFEPGRPVGFAFLPDSRILIIERNTGFVRVHVPGTASAPLIHTIPDLDIEAERGLLGIAVDPDWPTRPYVYVYYSHDTSTGRVEMLTADGALSDAASDSLSFASSYLLFDDLPDGNPIHNGGTLRFGPDGMLYLSLGDDGVACRAQDPSILAGGILRLDVSSMPGAGAGPPPKADLVPASGNPLGGPGDNERLFWAWGFRNPYRFTIDPLTGDLAIGEVGLTTEEEVDVLPYPAGAGSNCGWPQREGTVDPGLGLTCGEGATFVEPVATYPHGFGAAVVGGPIYRAPDGAASPWPAAYEGSLFYTDFYQAFLRRLVFDGAQWGPADPVPGQPDAENWGANFYYFADLQTGPDGAMYLMRLIPFTGRPSGLYRIVSTAPTSAPEVAAASGPGDVRAFPNPAEPGQAVEFAWSRVGTSGPAVVALHDVAGRRVRSWTVAEGDASASWDGLDEEHRPARPGVYFVSVEGGGAPIAAGRVVIVR
jgi:glucose/arabinose dehydrogenase